MAITYFPILLSHFLAIVPGSDVLGDIRRRYKRTSERRRLAISGRVPRRLTRHLFTPVHTGGEMYVGMISILHSQNMRGSCAVCS